MRLAWTTDIHLNHVPLVARERWLTRIAGLGCDGILISGDIAESSCLLDRLRQIAQAVSAPVYFVLGNHDFYGSSIGATVQQVIRACREVNTLHYLTDLSAVPLGGSGPQPGNYLVGEDGWGDTREGDYEHSYVRLNDFTQIRDFCDADPAQWKEMLVRLGAVSAERLSAKLLALPEDAAHVVVLTHVPPFREACWYEGRTTDDDWAPFFVCGQVGQVLRRVSQTRPQCRYTVLCGHTHHSGIANLEPNLRVYTGAACYGKPDILAIVNVTPQAVRLQELPVAPESR